MNTSAGRTINPWDMRLEDLDINEAAHALSLLNRFNGHTVAPYSVAQHSCLVSDYCGSSHLTRLAGLLHDVTEAYLGDVVTPIKRRPELAAYREAENRLAAVVKAKWNVEAADWETVDQIDRDACVSEARSLFASIPEWTEGRSNIGLITSVWPWQRAKGEFLKRFARLTAVLAATGEWKEKT